MRIWRKAGRIALSALLIAAASLAQDAKTPFGPVPVEQRKELAKRLNDYTRAFRSEDWDSLYDLAADVNKKRNDGNPMSKEEFRWAMKEGFDAWQLLKFTPIRTEMTAPGQFDVYGCGEFPSGEGKPGPVAVAVRAVREHSGWFFTSWAYFDPRQPCSNLSDPAWTLSGHLSLEYLPALTCDIFVCTD